MGPQAKARRPLSTLEKAGLSQSPQERHGPCRGVSGFGLQTVTHLCCLSR